MNGKTENILTFALRVGILPQHHFRGATTFHVATTPPNYHCSTTFTTRRSISRLTLRLATPRPTEDETTEDEAPQGHAVVVHAWPQTAAEIENWVGRLAKEHELPLTWRREGLGVAACRVLKAFLSQRHRCRPSPALQAQIVSAHQRLPQSHLHLSNTVDHKKYVQMHLDRKVK
jgi:hypothetical protein